MRIDTFVEINQGQQDFGPGILCRSEWCTSIKTKIHLMPFSDSSWQDFPDTGRSTGACNIFYQCGTIDHGTHVPGLVAQ